MTGQMTDAEAISAVRGGQRALTATSILAAETPDPGCVHAWRTVACDFDTDVLECSRCGNQRLAACDFDDDFA